MAEITQKTRIQLRCDTLANWKKSTVKLLKGELAFATDTNEYRLGNGSGTWSQLSAPSAVVKKNGDPSTSDTDYNVGTLWFNAKEGTLFALTTANKWSKTALDDDLKALEEKLDDYMLTEEYSGSAFTKTVGAAESLVGNGGYLSVDDSNSEGMWSAEHTEQQIATAKEEAIEEAYEKVVAEKGVANGFASLDKDGKVPSAQLPSYVDDVEEVSSYAALTALKTNGTAEKGKIYVITGSSSETGNQKNTQWRFVSTSTGFVQITSGNISVDDKSNIAYSATKGAKLEEVMEAVTGTLTGKTMANFNEEVTDNGTFSERISLLEDFKTKIKDCVIVKTGDDTNLIITDNLTDLCVTNEKLAADAVNTINLVDGAVTTAKIADGAVTASQIAQNTITYDNLSSYVQGLLGGDSADSSDKIEDLSVSTAKLADGAVTDAKVTSVSVSKLVADANTTLILNCGNAS